MNKISSLQSSTSLGDSSLRKVKDCYVRCGAYVMLISVFIMLINRFRGVITIGTRTNEPQLIVCIEIFRASRDEKVENWYQAYEHIGHNVDRFDE